MAILLDFEKIREDERQVEYIFGYPEMDRRLVIEKGSLQGSPVEPTTSDKAYAAVLWKILRLRQERNGWPESGMYAA